mgnify:CR=1 FL=1
MIVDIDLYSYNLDFECPECGADIDYRHQVEDRAICNGDELTDTDGCGAIYHINTIAKVELLYFEGGDNQGDEQ